jgi:hypothetical protein
VVSSSPTDKTPSKNQDKETLVTKIMAKRSIRGIFNRERARAKTPETVASKQGFVSATRSSLAKVMRDPKSLSKVHLPRKTESRLETESDHAINTKSIEAGIFATFDNDSKATPAQEAMPRRRSHADEVLHDIVDRIDAQPEDSPERLRHVQIAEVCETLRLRSIMLEELLLTVKNKQRIILAAEYSRNANISALEAKKSARDAELYADRAQLEFKRLHTLLDGADIDAQSMKPITNLLPGSVRNGTGEETRRGILSGMRTTR